VHTAKILSFFGSEASLPSAYHPQAERTHRITEDLLRHYYFFRPAKTIGTLSKEVLLKCTRGVSHSCGMVLNELALMRVKDFPQEQPPRRPQYLRTISISVNMRDRGKGATTRRGECNSGESVCFRICCATSSPNSSSTTSQALRVVQIVLYVLNRARQPALVAGVCQISLYFSVIVIVVTNQDSTSSRLLPGSSYSCCIRNLHALVHKQCHPVHITTAHAILQRRQWQLCKSTLQIIDEYVISLV
jgi:hypothetical protein